MGLGKKLDQREVAVALGISESEVSANIADNEPMADGSGYWIYFSIHSPQSMLDRFKVGPDRVLAYRSGSVVG